MSRRLIISVLSAIAVVGMAIVAVVLLRNAPGDDPLARFGTITVDGRVPGRAAVPVGDRLDLDFGRVSPSVGDAWFLVTKPDATVLRDLGQDWTRPSDCEGPGCPLDLTWKFEGVAGGTTTLTFQYCYRSKPPACEGEPSQGKAAPAPVTIEVTVR